MNYMFKLTTIFVILGAITSYFFFATYQKSTPDEAASNIEPAIKVPNALLRNFPDTDWSKADPALEAALSGGPAKDGIPAIDIPKFIALNEFEGSNEIQTIVLDDSGTKKVYPYSILTWHEIVNDTVNDIPVAITFCPLCGSAIVFDRTLPDGTVTTFGVSGSLLESNMIMYDRATESLWQQSTGQTLAGTYHEAELNHIGFQFMTLGEVRANFSDALILSEDTGYRRDYRRNPYAGYETNNQFVFEPSEIDTTYNPKTIMVVFDLNGVPIVADWDSLRKKKSLQGTVAQQTIFYNVSEGSQLKITDQAGTEYPFYFEMWFSVAAQHGKSIVIINEQ